MQQGERWMKGASPLRDPHTQAQLTRHTLCSCQGMRQPDRSPYSSDLSSSPSHPTSPLPPCLTRHVTLPAAGSLPASRPALTDAPNA